MKNWFKKRQVKNIKQNIFVLTALFTLLPVLAILQYYWLGQLSEGEKARMQSNIRISSQRFAEDFDFELSKIYSKFSNIDLKNESNPQVIKNTLHELDQVLAYPGLIKDVFMVDCSNSQKAEIYEYLQNKGVFVKINWPSRFKDIYQHLFKDNTSPLAALITMSHQPSLADPPVIVISANPLTHKIWTDKSVINFLIIELSGEVITGDLLASLAQKYFNSNDERLYDFAIVKKDSVTTLFYKSSAEPVADFINSAETYTDIGTWRLERFMVAATKVVLNDSIKEFSGTKKIRVSNDQQISLEIINQDSVFKKESFEFTITKSVPWRLYIKHRSGKLDTIVGNARTRNLVLSYLILLLLGLSIAFVYSNARKTQKTALQQLEFVAGLTHELRTPLATIRSAAENIKDGVIKDAVKVKEYGELIYKEDVRLSQMIEQTLYFSGISFGGQKIKKEETDIIDILQKIIKHYEMQTIQMDLKELPKIQADGDSLRIAFNNLVSNAVKYNKEDNPVIIKAYPLEQQPLIEIQIIDQGKGISTQDLPYIFNLFYRGEEAKQNQVRGSGIGLSLVKKIIDAHEGSISVKSEPGKGSIFTVTLPV